LFFFFLKKEKFLDPNENLYDLIKSHRQNGIDSEKFYLVQKVCFYFILFYFIIPVYKNSNKNDSNKKLTKIKIKKRLSTDLLSSAADQGVLRVYGGPLNVDVAYRAVFIDINTTAETVVAMTLEKYNSKEDPKDFQISLLTDGQRYFLFLFLFLFLFCFLFHSSFPGLIFISLIL